MTDQTDNSQIQQRHSRLGIASLIMAIAIPVLLGLFFTVAMILGTKKGSVGGYILIGVAIFAFSAPLLHLIGLIFGIIGWISKKTKKLFPIIGTILNFILGFAGSLILVLVFYQLIKVGGLILH